MSASQEISSHIPCLRRFARALVGSQKGGDAYVLATLEAIVANPLVFSAKTDVRIALYGLFLKVWNASPGDEPGEDAGSSGDERGARKNLDAISLRPRIAFLLNALEGFPPAYIAQIMDLTPDDAMRLVDAAGREIADQICTDVLIIEDEPFIALDLQTLVEELGHRVTNIARTHREASAAARDVHPGLILADIQLADGSSGLEAVNEILGDFEVPVIFVTAYPERFLTGQQPEPAFLISKPFTVDSLKAVISQALFFDRRSRRKSEAALAT